MYVSLRCCLFAISFNCVFVGAVCVLFVVAVGFRCCICLVCLKFGVAVSVCGFCIVVSGVFFRCFLLSDVLKNVSLMILFNCVLWLLWVANVLFVLCACSMLLPLVSLYCVNCCV